MATSATSVHDVAQTRSIELREIHPASPNLDSSASKPDAVSETVIDTPAESRQKRNKGRLHYATLCWFMFLAGWNDGTAGPLIPRMQTVYHANYTIVSLIFVCACFGFLSGAFANIVLTPKLGFGKLMILGSLCQVTAYSLQAPGLPFPVFVIAYMINGVGLAFQDAQANGYVACYKRNPETKMALFHAVYGAGALCSPLVATRFAYIPHWSFHYLTSLGLALLNTVFLFLVFKLRTQDECLAEIGESAGESGSSQHSALRQVLTLRNVHLLALFILVYVGVEFTLGGWIVTYVIEMRGGGETAGYISSGFFGGLTVGRLALLWVNKLVGERRVLFFYALLAIGLEVIVWRVPSLVGNGVAVSLVGVLLGPMYPIVMNHSSRILPPWLLTGCIGWIAGFGQAGTALFPFITGAMASSVGISSLQPLLVAMMSFMIILWAIVPGEKPKLQ
ncbi:MFS general substrate transporter [Guyanagaster necrorhizus]|uniref:MFS general substrate transporter n=1 Tax=Guyanagaster necrorhizus TaxID=856835 RepID=A0A9P7VV82_9AGAR|nr:MFS general substrate transporter [Guyanagaster necrorhizus MCA 3950]KAG7448141.1 MFS general substrate transporter [Guyanagaster necrorhizus MCA 3950]